jgi:hypothetical protein
MRKAFENEASCSAKGEGTTANVVIISSDDEE